MGGVGSGGSGGTGGGTVRLLPNPEDVRSLGNEAARSLIGADLDQAQQEAFISAFYSAYQPQGGYSPASPDVFTENYIKDTLPGEYGAHKLTEVYDAFANMLDGL